jgi:phosphoglycerate dehydrogenase-like enzyme
LEIDKGEINMSYIWDLPEQVHPVNGRRTKRHYDREERPEEHFEKVGKTITDAAVTVVGLGVIGSLGANLISTLKPK